MHRFGRTRFYRSLSIVALGTLAITGCRQGTTTPGSEPPPGIASGIEIEPVLAATAVVGDDRSATTEYPTYYLYILDRDGVPVRRFECDGQSVAIGNNGPHCQRPDRAYIMVSEAVPVLLTTDELPLKGEQPMPGQ